MPPSIDPIQTMFGTGTGLFGRILTAFASGWLGILFSRICAATEEWNDIIQLHEVIEDVLNTGPVEALFFVAWPLVGIYFIFTVPLYGLLMFPFVVLALFKIILTDDPILFWALLIVAMFLPGFAISYGTVCSIVPMALLGTGILAGLWWSLNLEHGEWIDTVQGWFEKDE